MEYVYDFIILLVWTSICVAFVYVIEQVFERFGYRSTGIDDGRDHIPPVPPE